MKILILDKVNEDRNTLKSIVQNEDLGFIVGEGNNIYDIKSQIVDLNPDLIIFDLIDNKDEDYQIIKEIKDNHHVKLIRISNNTSKYIVERSYRSGIDYFIYKPLNHYEIKTIINRVKIEIEETNKLREIKKLINDINSIHNKKIEENKIEKNLNSTLLKLGIIGEKGTEDIRMIVEFMAKNNININNISIRELCSNFTDRPKNMEQKIRRAINMAMINIANLGIEDYMNENFIEYSNTLFNFEQIKKEMDYIRGKSIEKGTINMKKFISGLYIVCENYNN